MKCRTIAGLDPRKPCWTLEGVQKPTLGIFLRLVGNLFFTNAAINLICNGRLFVERELSNFPNTQWPITIRYRGGYIRYRWYRFIMKTREKLVCTSCNGATPLPSGCATFVLRKSQPGCDCTLHTKGLGFVIGTYRRNLPVSRFRNSPRSISLQLNGKLTWNLCGMLWRSEKRHNALFHLQDGSTDVPEGCNVRTLHDGRIMS